MTNQLNFNDFFTFFDKLINIRLTFNEFLFNHQIVNDFQFNFQR